MIIDNGGRYKSVRTKEEVMQLLLNDFGSLSEDELAVVMMAIEDISIDGYSPILQLANEDLYESPPVSMETFIKDDYFLGVTGKSLYPGNVEALLEMCSGQYTQAVIGGSLGSGKTTVGVIALLRILYEISCLKNPQEAYRIASADKIIFPCVSITEDAAERNVLDKLRAYISDSPYFSEEFKSLSDTAGGGIVFPKNLVVPPGVSTAAGVIGGNAFAAFIDESNFFHNKKTAGDPNSKQNIELIYEAIRRRIETRFTSKVRLPGLIIIASSKTTTDAFSERLIRKSITDPLLYCKESASYEVHPKERYSGVTFRVAIGSETTRSRLVFEGEPDPEGMKVIEVPIEFRESFENDIDSSIRDISGYATAAITPYISRREKIYDCVDKTRTHPFSMEIWDQDIQGRIDWSKICTIQPDGSWKPKYHPSAPRHIHLDLSKNHDTTGFSMGCISHYESVHKVGGSEETLPSFFFDFMLKIRAQTNGEIQYSEIRNLIYQFSAHGFFIKLVTADQFQSAAVLQTLKEQGYKTDLVSVDRTTNPYETLKSAFYENRVSLYNYPPVLGELKKLQKNWKTGKIDHPDGGEKDVSDTLAAVAFTLVSAGYHAKDQPMREYGASHLAEENDQFYLDDPRIIVQHEQEIDKTLPEWRQNAIKQQRESGGNPFDSPFVIG